MKTRYYILIGAIIFIAVNFFIYKSVVSDRYRLTQELKLHLSEIGKLNNQIDKQSLSVRRNTVISYDKMVFLLEVLQNHKNKVTTSIDKNSDFKKIGPYDRNLLNLIQSKKELLESFKSKNSILRNSLNSIGILVENTQSTNVPLDLLKVKNSLLEYSLYENYDTKQELKKSIDKLKNRFYLSNREYRMFFLHAEIILDLSPNVDRLLSEITRTKITGVSNKMMIEVDKVSQEYLKTLKNSIFFFIILNILFFLVISLIANKLSKKTKELIFFNESLEEKVENRTSEIKQKNEELNQFSRELIVAKEKALESAKIKQDFLANMSHEIRTPMSAILGFCNLLQEKIQPNTDEAKFLTNINTSATNLLAIINDIIDFSIIESGKLKIESIDINLNTIMDNVIDTYKLPASKKNNQLKLEVDSNIPKYIKGDPVRINQILINLIGNAIKFTKDGIIEIKVLIKESNTIQFEVRDTGIGIDKSKMKAIFESFTQADTNTTRLYGGTGLGLSIVKKMVELMGGTINVESKLHKGSNFYFTLPLKIGKEPTISEETYDESSNISDLKILVLEDDNFIQLLIKKHLKELGCDYILAGNGKEGFDTFLNNKNEFDIILTDIQMPLMDGHEFTKKVREINKSIPIIAMTAHALESEKKKCIKNGMNSVLIKPFKANEIKNVLYTFAGVLSQ